MPDKAKPDQIVVVRTTPETNNGKLANQIVDHIHNEAVKIKEKEKKP